MRGFRPLESCEPSASSGPSRLASEDYASPRPVSRLHAVSAKRPVRLPPGRSRAGAGAADAGDQTDDYLTRADVAKLLAVSPNTVTRWAREGRLACLVTLGGHHRFKRELIEQLRKRLTQPAGR